MYEEIVNIYQIGKVFATSAKPEAEGTFSIKPDKNRNVTKKLESNTFSHRNYRISPSKSEEIENSD